MQLDKTKNYSQPNSDKKKHDWLSVSTLCPPLLCIYIKYKQMFAQTTTKTLKIIRIMPIIYCIISPFTRSVYCELLAPHELVDELWDELLGVLVGAVHVVPAGDDHREVEGPGDKKTKHTRQDNETKQIQTVYPQNIRIILCHRSCGHMRTPHA